MRDYCGWRARIGLIYMASSTVMEPEFNAMAPDGVATLVARLHLPKATVAGLGQMMEGDEVERCAESLANADLHVIAFGGTSATFLNGPAWDDKVKARMAERGKGRPVTATSSASAKGLRGLGVKRMTFLGPYVDEVTERGHRFFAASGFDVLASHGMGIDEDHAIGAVPLERVYEFARRHAHPQSEGIFISCTNLRTVGAIAALEADLGIPVVTAIQATFWDSLRLAGVRDRISGFGRLFDH
ncbi:MAG: maleate cis-trans isomerase family protein [Alphaproteobacteria bacterium]